MNKHNLKVGQHIFVERDYDRGKPTEYVISKIGRKWVEYNFENSRFTAPRGRFELETLHDEHRGKVWLSLEQRTQHRLLAQAWGKFCDDIANARYRRPLHVSHEDIAEVRLKLGL